MGKPCHYNEIAPQLESFISWLVGQGLTVAPTKSEWEVIRALKKGGPPALLYRKANGRLTWTPAISLAWESYKAKQPLKGAVRVTRRGKSKAEIIEERDGNRCFFCGHGLTPENRTQEHLLSKVSGGSNHMDNLVLACKPCNLEAGNLPIIDKVKLRERKRFKAGLPLETKKTFNPT